LEREPDLIELYTDIFYSIHSVTKCAENDIDSLWKELNEFGSLPVKDDDTKESTKHLKTIPTENYFFKRRVKKKQ
jgi:hypothetical protein